MYENTTPTNPFVSVVIVSWNRRIEIEYVLDEYKKQTYKNFEMVVVDNNSTDGTRELIKERFPEIRLIELPENTGYHAFNVGMQNAKGEILIVSDDDAFLEPDGISRIVDKFNANPNLGIAVSKPVSYPLEIDFPWTTIKNTDPTKSYDVHWFNSVGIGMRKSMFEKIGYFDEDYFFWGCEIDFATQAIAAGYDVKYFPNILVYHKYYSKKLGIKEQRVWKGQKNNTGAFLYYSSRNIILYYWKNYPFHIALGRSIIRIPYDFLWTLFRGKFTVSPFKAWKGIITGFNQTLKKRKVVPKQYVRKALGYQSEIVNLYSFLRNMTKYEIDKYKYYKKQSVKETLDSQPKKKNLYSYLKNMIKTR